MIHSALRPRTVLRPLQSISFCALLCFHGAPAVAAQLGTNLVVNGDAEANDTNGWLNNTGIETNTTVSSGAAGLSDPFSIGQFCFHAGQGPDVQGMEQTIGLSSYAQWIDAGAITSHFEILIQSRRAGGVDDTGWAILRFRDGAGFDLASATFTDPPSLEPFDWQLFTDDRTIPVGTRSIRVELNSNRTGGVSTEAFFDNIVIELDVASSGLAYCFGDGSGMACPCSGQGNPGAGCLNSTGSTGATLVGSGTTSFSNDTFQLQVSGVPGAKPGLILRGNNQVMLPAGAGFLCVTGASQRSQVQLTNAGSAVFTNFQGTGFSSVAQLGGSTHFQFWYRDPANPCGGQGFNFSNGWTTLWGN